MNTGPFPEWDLRTGEMTTAPGERIARDLVGAADQVERVAGWRPDAAMVGPGVARELSKLDVALLRQPHLYADTTPQEEISRRRRAARVARKSRRQNRRKK